jgi:hypothetical protein
MDPQPQDMQEFSAPALREWSRHVEAVLRGLAHSMNNRAAAISAVLELSREPDDDPAATRQILEDEMVRIQELVRSVRAVGAPRHDVEALSPADLVPDAMGVIELHGELRDRTVRFQADGAPPVRVPRWMLLRAMIAVAATTPPAPGERTVTLRLESDGDWLVVRSAAAKAATVYAGELARAMGGEPLPDGSGVRIPILESLRRREAR